jgi:hypothetical protein
MEDSIMSSFVVNDIVIDKIFAITDNMKELHEFERREFAEALGLRLCFDYESSKAYKEAVNELGTDMLILNNKSVQEEYKHNEQFTNDINNYTPVNYEVEYVKCSLIESFKALQCFIYQIEGEHKETILYKKLIKLKTNLAEVIIMKTPEYNNANWG